MAWRCKNERKTEPSIISILSRWVNLWHFKSLTMKYTQMHPNYLTGTHWKMCKTPYISNLNIHKKTLKPSFNVLTVSLSGNYSNVNYPAPSFVNPIPWKPIHVPQEDRTPRKSSVRKRTTGAAKSQSSRRLTHTPKDKRRWHWHLLVSVQC